MKSARTTRQAFTLIELMLVVAILGIALAMGYPAISSALHRAPLTQGIIDITDGCRKARSQAILKDSPTEFRIYSDGRLEVVDAPADIAATLNPAPTAAPTKSAITTDNDPENRPPSSFSKQLNENVAVELIAVNFVDFQGADVARVRFYPNGTSDEFTVVLLCEGERRKITLEVVTALTEVSAL